MPQGFWIVTDNDIFHGRSSLTGLTMRKPTNILSGSPAIPWGDNWVDAVLNLLAQCNDTI